jgi:hypothetical protein
MADIYLGLEGSEVTLPQANSIPGSIPNLPVGYQKQLDKKTMVDGSTRFNSKTYHPRTWALSWDQLPIASITALITLANYNVRLRFKNEWIDASYHWVMVVKFEFSPVVFRGTVMYKAAMELEEVV